MTYPDFLAASLIINVDIIKLQMASNNRRKSKSHLNWALETTFEYPKFLRGLT